MKSPGKPAPQDLTYDDVVAIVRLIESGSRFTDFRLRHGDIEVEIHRANGVVPDVAPASRMPEQLADPHANAAPAARAVAVPEGAHLIKSPMVGTFYRASGPGAKPFVEEGVRVFPDTVVCIIEVMKLMNSVSAGVHGVVERVLVENAHMVEFGQPLVAIRVTEGTEDRGQTPTRARTRTGVCPQTSGLWTSRCETRTNACGPRA